MTALPPVPATGDARWQEATIERITDETPTVKRFVLRPQRWQPFLPGQHVDVRLTASDGYRAHRSYSIASAPGTRGTVELAVERLDDGEVSPFFHQVAAVGDTIEVRFAPAEHFVWRPGPGEDVLLVAGGSGVAPLMAMLRHRASVAGAGRMLLLYSARTREDVIFRDELRAQEAAQSGLDVVLCLTRGAPWRPGDHGRRVDAAIVDGVLARFPRAPAITFVCGSNRFVASVTDLLVDRGLPAPSIRTERFGGA